MSLARFCNKVILIAAVGTAVFMGSSRHLLAQVTLPNLPPGSQYEIIFATSTETAVSSGSLGFYNSFVSTSAGTLNSLLPPGVTWHAVASTGAAPNDAKDNAPSAAGIPIYNTHGIEVSPGNLYSGAVPPFYDSVYRDRRSAADRRNLDGLRRLRKFLESARFRESGIRVQ